MKRVFQFKNNYFSKEAYAVAAEYNAIGYFDGLDMRRVEDRDKDAIRIMSDPYYTLVEDDGCPLKEKCDYFNILGISMVDDFEFWNDKTLPLIFITFVRFQDRIDDYHELIDSIVHEAETDIKQVENDISDIRIDAKIIGYYTFDSSDLIICLRTNSYVRGTRSISKYPNYVNKSGTSIALQKSFSICVIKQTVLDCPTALDKVVDDTISCLLRCVVRDREMVEAYCEKLEQELWPDTRGRVIAFDVLGSDDIMLFGRNIDIKRLLRLYAANSLLTHSNRDYKAAFFNITTEILVTRKEDDRCIMVRNT